MYKALSVRCQQCTKKNKKKIVLRCMAIGACAVKFLHFIPLYSAIYYIALLFTVAKKRVCAPVAHKIVFDVSLYFI